VATGFTGGADSVEELKLFFEPFGKTTPPDG
jgi:hypothetical protein